MSEICVHFLNGDTRMVEGTTVNDVKVRISHLFTAVWGEKMILPAEVVVLSFPEGNVISGNDLTHVSVVFCENTRTENVWMDSFHSYATYGDMEGVSRCLQELLAFDAQFVERALSKAAQQGDVKVVQALVADGTNIEDANNAQNTFGWTALHWAVFMGAADIVELLLSLKGRNMAVNAKEDNWMTPLHMAVIGGRREIVEMLLTRGQDVAVNVQNGGGATPLHLAARHGNRDIVELLLTHGATVDTQSNEGETPLHVAVRMHDKAIAELLFSSSSHENSSQNIV